MYSLFVPESVRALKEGISKRTLVNDIMAGVIVGIDPDPANAEKITHWCKDYYNGLHPYSSGGAYSNFMMDEGQERVKASYRHNYDRLVKIKQRFDPNNLFKVNQNIKP